MGASGRALVESRYNWAQDGARLAAAVDGILSRQDS
jgi:hypothetical protein